MASAALGEADTRARAIRAGWRIDALRRLACPRCVQTDAGFRATAPVVPWDRYTAMAKAAAVSSDGTTADWGSSHYPGRGVGSHPYPGPPDLRWHQSAPPFLLLSP